MVIPRILHNSQGMKKLLAFIMGFSVLIAAVMFFLVKDGISLRSAPVIRPSKMTDDPAHIAKAVAQRLFPDFQSSPILTLGTPPQSPLAQQVSTALISAYEDLYQKKIQLLSSGQPTPTEVASCESPCWILLSPEETNELEPGLTPERLLSSGGRAWINLTLVPYDRSSEIPADCLQEKRLSLRCLIPLSIQEAKRRMRDPDARYFFMRKYNDRDFFLFFEESSLNP